MTTVLAPDPVDLDFTYGDEFAHPYDRNPRRTLCGAPVSTKHRGHGGSIHRDELPPKKCPGCGTPVCPTCAHIHAMDWELR